MRRKSQLTLRGLDARALQAIRELAKRERISINKAALRLLDKGAGVPPRPQAEQINDSLDHLIGTWSDREAKTFLSSIRACEQVDADLWE
ncbi:MAG: hypothetical protein JWP01_1414 [Myxococcales bacterium]|nr:hypothetical protein [Myxococcales bacterium]